MENKTHKQQLLLQYLISSTDTFALSKSIVKSSYFDPEFRNVVTFIHQYYDQYNATPSPDQIFAETSVKITKDIITRDQVQYCTNEIEKFCRRKAVEEVILAAPSMISNNQYAKVEAAIRDAIAISLTSDMGVDYFNNPIERLEKQLETATRVSTGWKSFDDVIAGGLARTEILLVSANSGGGKSMTLANIACNFLEQGYNVLYLTLELSQELVSQRFDTMFTGVSSAVWRQKYKEIARTLTNLSPEVGKLTIKHMSSGTNAGKIRAYLKEFELQNGYVPDLLIVDYLDLMGANEQVSADNIWEKDKRATEQLKDIGIDYNMFIATASQQNRSAIDAQQLNQSIIAGGISKVNTVDWYASIIMTSQMKAAGEMAIQMLKTRNSDGVGKTVHLKWDAKNLRIRDIQQESNEEILQFKPKQPTSKPKQGLDDLFEE